MNATQSVNDQLSAGIKLSQLKDNRKKTNPKLLEWLRTYLTITNLADQPSKRTDIKLEEVWEIESKYRVVIREPRRLS